MQVNLTLAILFLSALTTVAAPSASQEVHYYNYYGKTANYAGAGCKDYDERMQTYSLSIPVPIRDRWVTKFWVAPCESHDEVWQTKQ